MTKIINVIYLFYLLGCQSYLFQIYIFVQKQIIDVKVKIPMHGTGISQLRYLERK